MIASLSLIGCPAALTLPGSANALAWSGLYHHGIALMPRAVTAIAVSYGYAGYDAYQRKRVEWKGYAVSALLAVAIIPWTLLTMIPTNNELLAMADGRSGGTLAANELIARWATLNLVRSLFPLAGAVVGFVSYARDGA